MAVRGKGGVFWLYRAKLDRHDTRGYLRMTRPYHTAMGPVKGNLCEIRHTSEKWVGGRSPASPYAGGYGIRAPMSSDWYPLGVYEFRHPPILALCGRLRR